jgi:pilus assembly protein Flp/PilA
MLRPRKRPLLFNEPEISPSPWAKRTFALAVDRNFIPSGFSVSKRGSGTVDANDSCRQESQPRLPQKPVVDDPAGQLRLLSVVFLHSVATGGCFMAKLLALKMAVIERAKRFFARKEEGASLVEYGILVGLIAVVCITAVAALGTEIVNVFNTIVSDLKANNV